MIWDLLRFNSEKFRQGLNEDVYPKEEPHLPTATGYEQQKPKAGAYPSAVRVQLLPPSHCPAGHPASGNVLLSWGTISLLRLYPFSACFPGCCTTPGCRASSSWLSTVSFQTPAGRQDGQQFDGEGMIMMILWSMLIFHASFNAWHRHVVWASSRTSVRFPRFLSRFA